MYAIISVHFVDNAQHPIDELPFEIRQAGILWKKGTTDKDGNAGSYVIVKNGTEAKSDVDKLVGGLPKGSQTLYTNSPDAPIEIHIVTDTKEKKLLHQTAIKWNQCSRIVARSKWIKINLPLTPNTAQERDEAQQRTETCGFATVQYEVGSPGTKKFATAKVIVCDLPKKIIDTAMKYRGSTVWAYSAAKSTRHPDGHTRDFSAGTNKCSLFVHDVLTEAGLKVPWIEYGRISRMLPWYQKLSPPVAEEWATAGKLATNWNSSSTPQPGDVGAYKVNYADASGHVGFVVCPGVTISAGSKTVLVNDAGFRVKKMTPQERTANDSQRETQREHDFTLFRRHKSVKAG